MNSCFIVICIILVLIHTAEVAVKTNKEPCRVRKKHCCFYCDIIVTNFSRHLERNHDDEVEVQKILSLKKNDLQRKNLINKLRKEGDFSTGNPIPVFGKSNEGNTSGYLPCIHCKGINRKLFLNDIRTVICCFW